ncbi:MAG: TetR/AcrR family transcriptional regulator [Alphaproteobacteria bacterium]
MVIENRKKIISALLSILEKNNYNSVTIEKISRSSKLKKETIFAEFADIESIVFAYLNQVDIEMLERVRNETDLSDPHELMFNMIINRLEIYDRNRKSILNLLSNKSKFRYKYFLLSTKLSQLFDGIYQGNKDEDKYIAHFSKNLGFIYIYKQVLNKWLNNNDMSVIMAYIDKQIQKGEMYYGYIKTPINILDNFLLKIKKTSNSFN